MLPCANVPQRHRRLFLLTDVAAVYTAHPKVRQRHMRAASGAASLTTCAQLDPSAAPITYVTRAEAATLDSRCGVAGDTAQWGTGGMAAKIRAARLASAAGVRAVITSTANVTQLQDIMQVRLRAQRTAQRLPHKRTRAWMRQGAKVGTLFEPAPRRPRGRKRWVFALPPRGADARTRLPPRVVLASDCSAGCTNGRECAGG